jgi:hypothetical protein
MSHQCAYSQYRHLKLIKEISRKQVSCYTILIEAITLDMAPLDYYLWGHTKSFVYETKPQMVAELTTSGAVTGIQLMQMKKHYPPICTQVF